MKTLQEIKTLVRALRTRPVRDCVFPVRDIRTRMLIDEVPDRCPAGCSGEPIIVVPVLADEGDWEVTLSHDLGCSYMREFVVAP